MSVRLRLTIGPLVVCDIELFATELAACDHDDEPPTQLAGGQGTIIEPYPDQPFGFQRER